MGFVVAHEPSTSESGYLWMDLSLKHPRVVQADEDGHRFSIDADDPV